MKTPAHNSYLETQVMTATPQRLRLMVLDAAIRAARECLQHWERNEADLAVVALAHCRRAVSELLCGIRPDGSDVARDAAIIYAFLFHTLTDAQHRQNERQVHDSLKILEIERETWQRVCEQTPEAPQRTHAAHEITASHLPPISTVEFGFGQAVGASISLDG